MLKIPFLLSDTKHGLIFGPKSPKICTPCFQLGRVPRKMWQQKIVIENMGEVISRDNPSHVTSYHMTLKSDAPFYDSAILG